MMRAWNSVATAASRRSLFIDQIADENVLREAWYRVQRGGKTAGVDCMTVDAFRPYADRRLTELGQALIADTYRPSPVKRVQTPKPAGGWHVLGIPTIGDRIAQTAAALVLHDRIAVRRSSFVRPQILLSPIFDDGHRLIFEFRRAHILSVSRRGEIETRLVAVDPVRGVVGTKTIHRRGEPVIRVGQSVVTSDRTRAEAVLKVAANERTALDPPPFGGGARRPSTARRAPHGRTRSRRQLRQHFVVPTAQHRLPDTNVKSAVCRSRAHVRLETSGLRVLLPGPL